MTETMNYLPLLAGAVCKCANVVARLLTNHYIKQRYEEILIAGSLFRGHIPQSVSALYLTSFLGFIVCVVWSFTIAWWAPITLLVLHFLFEAVVPSQILKARRDLRSGPRKCCDECGQLFPLDHFPEDREQPDRYSATCGFCWMSKAEIFKTLQNLQRFRNFIRL
jgi:hypothetical protein